MNTAELRPFPSLRRGTWTFLHAGARETCHVYLMTDVDASAMRAARRASGGKLSYVSMLVKAAADEVAQCPPARSVLVGRRSRPRLAELADVDVKVLFDKSADGTRCVVSGTVAAAQRSSVLDVQEAIDAYKDAPLDGTGPFRDALRVNKLPLPVARLLFRAAMRDPVRRSSLQGAFSVTSVGQEPVRAIFPMIYGTCGFGIGRITDTPVAVDGEVRIAPRFTLTLTFDHRVIDGALASDLLARTKERLEHWAAPLVPEAFPSADGGSTSPLTTPDHRSLDAR